MLADDRPWWGMQYVPFNGGAAVPDWVRLPTDRPRVGVTLGTVVPRNTGTTSLGVVIEALAALEVDVVLAAGLRRSHRSRHAARQRALGRLPAPVGVLAYCTLLIHHGGSGTTAAPLFYGVPQLVLPAFADNPLSAQRVVDRGVGLAHDPATIDP